MKDMKNSSTRGILHATAGKEKFTLSRFEPSIKLKPFVEHYWIIRYDLQSVAPYTLKVLSYSNVHLSFEQDEEGRRFLLYGIPLIAFVCELRAAGRVLGVKFRAGGFHPFWRQNVSLLTGTTLPASNSFGDDVETYV